MKKVFFLFAVFPVLFFLLFPQVSFAASYTDTYCADDFSDFHSEELSLYAGSAVLIDADSGRILYGKSAAEPMANASTTKILTCILAIENGSLDDVVTVSDYACSMPQVKLGFSSGDRFLLEDLLLSLMLESHNDTAVAVAEHIAGSVEAFADLMNAKAEELGCTDSHFVTPNGLDGEDDGGEHHTTAYDLSLIMAYCIQNETFLKITQTASAQISTADGEKSWSLTNHNAFLQMMEGSISGKTGFTSKAGYCYVGAYQNGTHVYTYALLACGWPNHKDYKWSDAKQLIAYADEMYEDRVLREGTAVLTLPLKNAVSVSGGHVSHPEEIAAATSEEAVTAFLSDEDAVDVRYDIPEYIDAPAEAGTEVGAEKIYLNGVLYAERKITLSESVEEYDFGWCMKWVISACFFHANHL